MHIKLSHLQLTASPLLSSLHFLLWSCPTYVVDEASHDCSLLTVSGDLAASPLAAFAASIAVTVPTSQASRSQSKHTGYHVTHGVNSPQIMQELTCSQGHGVSIHAGGEGFAACKRTYAACLCFITDFSAQGFRLPKW